MPTIYITSGTSWTAPSDFTANNKIECYGAGAAGQAGTGGGGGSYAKVLNLSIAPGSVKTIHIGSAGARDTYFNASSLANAVSNGTGVSCGAQGATGATGGAASSSCGTTKFNGGNGSGGGGSVGSGGGGGCAGPNGAGGSGGAGGAVNYGGGGGGGGANGGTNGGSGSTNVGGTGGNGGRTGTGGGASNAAGTAGTGGGAGGAAPNTFDGHKGAFDDVYGDGVHGPGGGGGGSTWDSGGSIQGFAGNGGSFGGGCGGYQSAAAQNVPGDGLIVITYTLAPPVAGMGNEIGALSVRRPSLSLYTSATILLRRDTLTPAANMAWYQQPTSLLHPPQAWVFQVPGQEGPPPPNPTPAFKNPFQTTPDIIIPRRTLDTRQQFPGKAPQDFHLAALEVDDILSGFSQTTSPINADIPEVDSVTSFTVPSPAKGSADDIVARVKLLLPKGWWRFHAPIRDAILGGIADLSSWSYSLFVYAKLQTRVAWATDIWLDIISRDYFGTTLVRKTNEADSAFRLRIQKELIRERVTRKGMIQAVEDLTGLPATVFEPWNTGDTGAWDNGTFALDIAGGWGDYLPAQAFLNVTPPGVQGIAGIGGWDSGYLAWDGGIGMWVDMGLITGAVTTQDIYDTINKTRPTGAIVWTQLFPAAVGVPPPEPPTLTPLTIPPCMIQQTISPPPRVQATMPQTQIEGSYAVNPVTPSRELPWLSMQPPIPRPAAVALQSWEPIGFSAWRATNPAAVLPWLPTLPVVQLNPAAYSMPVMPDSV